MTKFTGRQFLGLALAGAAGPMLRHPLGSFFGAHEDGTQSVRVPALDVGERKVVVLSDIHLGDMNDDFLDPLKKLLDDCREEKHPDVHVVLLGDFIDPWMASDKQLRGESEVLDLVTALAEAKRLSYVVGNHDFRLRDDVYGYPERPATNDEKERLLVGPYRSRHNFAREMGLDQTNTYHRYLLLKTGNRPENRWLFVHGDEIDFGEAAKIRLGRPDTWPGLLYDFYRRMDRVPARLVRAVGDAGEWVADVLGRAWARTLTKTQWQTRAIRSWGTQDLQQILTDPTLRDPQRHGAMSEEVDAYFIAVLSDLEDITGKDPDELEEISEQQAAAAARLLRQRRQPTDPKSRTVADLVYTVLRDRARIMPPSLPVVPRRLTGAPPEPFPSANLQEVSFPPSHVHLVIGHRHEKEVCTGPKGRFIIDAGSWQADSDNPGQYYEIRGAGYSPCEVP